jgi:hypothetical protein
MFPNADFSKLFLSFHWQATQPRLLQSTSLYYFEERPSHTARWGNFGVGIRLAWQNRVGNRNRWFKLEKEQQAKWYRPQTAKVRNLCHSAIGNPCFLN